MLRHVLSVFVFATLAAVSIVTTPSSAADPNYWRDGKTIPAIPYAAWEAGGKVTVVSGGEAVAKAPAKAVKYTVKTMHWPTGATRVFAFTKAGGGVLYTLTDESHFIVVKGSVKVMVGDKPTILNESDVGSALSGVIRSGNKVEDTMVVAWIVNPVSIETPTPTVVRANEGSYGSRGVNLTPPPPGENVTKRFAFPGNSIRYAMSRIPNTDNKPNTGALDNFIYMVDGHVQYTQGGETYQVHGGDFFRQEAGTVHAWRWGEGVRFVVSSALPVGVSQRMAQDKIN